MDTITGKILKLHGWPDGKVIGIAKKIGAELADQGLAGHLAEVVLAHGVEDRGQDLVAAIGPAACGRCYEVGDEVAAEADLSSALVDRPNVEV